MVASKTIQDKPKQVTQMSNPPTKEVVRQWLHQRQAGREPPPSIEQIRRELGWKLVKPWRANVKDEPLLAA